MLKILKSLGIIILTFVVLILIIYLWVFVETEIKLKNYPEFLNYKFYLVKDTLELKDIDKDDLLIIDEKNDIKKGNVVLYLDNNSTYTLARVKDINSVSVSLKNDFDGTEKTLNKSVIVGSATKKITGFGKLISIFSNKILLLVLVIVGFLLFVIAQEKLSKPKQIV